jgi:hypothetical protein
VVPLFEIISRKFLFNLVRGKLIAFSCVGQKDGEPLPESSVVALDYLGQSLVDIQFFARFEHRETELGQAFEEFIVSHFVPHAAVVQGSGLYVVSGDQVDFAHGKTVPCSHVVEVFFFVQTVIYLYI